MPVEIWKDQVVIRRSRNLRGLLDYARDTAIRSVEVSLIPERKPSTNEARLLVCFEDGAQCLTEFASFSVLCDWLRNRRSWHGVPVYAGRVLLGPLSNRNPLETTARQLCHVAA